ncbi:MAG: hypothetical protein L6Q59_14620 [Ignavibacteriaceae bacterium]|nr:hypothetical protein [Ignavibacteriaceae bacterium]
MRLKPGLFFGASFPSAEADGKRGSAEVLLFQLVLTGDSVVTGDNLNAKRDYLYIYAATKYETRLTSNPPQAGGLLKSNVIPHCVSADNAAKAGVIFWSIFSVG